MLINPHEITQKIILFVKREIVLFTASMLAVLSMFFVRPSKQYVGYVDFSVLSLLFCLMVVIAGLRSIGVFEKILQYLLQLVNTTRQLAFALVFVCFLTSMWITNDVALITFVPFAIMVLHKIKKDKFMLYIIVMQTVAANLGSMCTPIGNPQNLYLYSVSGMTIWSFFKLLFPYTAISFLLIGAGLLFIRSEPVEYDATHQMARTEVFTYTRTKLIAFLILFVLCILTVLHIVNYKMTFVIVIVAVLFLEKRLLLEADYMLLLTFVVFFIFVGNIKNIAVIEHMLAQSVSGNEVVISLVASQFISNVPAAVLLSGFTNHYARLMIGTNIGGLGTLIASMASLISFRFYTYTTGCNRKKYVGVFTLVNLIFLIILILAAYILQ